MSRILRPVVLAVAALAGAAPSAPAAVHVTDAGDTGDPGQLRQVIAAAPAAETVLIDAGVGPITLTQGAISLDKTLTIEGRGATATTVGAGDSSRVFLATAGDLTLRGLTIRDGAFTNPGNVFLGGGGCVANLGPGSVALDDVVVTECSVTGSSGGGVYLNGADIVVNNSAITKSRVTDPGDDAVGGGGIYANGGDVTVTDSDISENVVDVSGPDPDAAGGGAISANGGNVIAIDRSSLVGNRVTVEGTGTGYPGTNGGGAINSQARTVKVLDSTVNDNTVTLTGAAHTGDSGGGAVYLNGTALEATDSTFAGNAVTQSTTSANIDGNGGGAIHGNGSRFTLSGVTISGNSVSFSAGGTGAETSGGGGLYSNGLNSASQVVNSTISGNTATLTPAPADTGGGGWFINGTGGVLANVTVAGNSTTGEGGGIFEPPALRNTVLAGNSAATGRNCSFWGTDIAPYLPSQGHNLEDAATCGLDGPQDIVGQPAKLGALAANGGPTKTRLPEPDSPAVDNGLNCPAGDQRGLARPFGPACDIGSVERGATDPVPPPVACGAAPLQPCEGQVPPPSPPTVCGPSGTVLPQCTGAPPAAPIVCGGTGTILPPCFNRLPQPDPLIVCGASFATILRSCDGLGLGIGGRPLGLDDQTFPVRVGCGPTGRARAAQSSVLRKCLVKLDLKLTSPLGGLASKLLPGLGATTRTQSLAAIDGMLEVTASMNEIIDKLLAGTQEAMKQLEPSAPALGELAAEAEKLEATGEQLQQLELGLGDIATSASRRRGGFLRGIGKLVIESTGGVDVPARTLSTLLGGSGLGPTMSGLFREITKDTDSLLDGFGALRASLTKARPPAGSGEPRAVASAARAKLLARRVAAALPIAARTAEVAYGSKVTVRLRAQPWARRVIRSSRRIGVRYGAAVVSRGDAKSTARRVTITRRKR